MRGSFCLDPVEGETEVNEETAVTAGLQDAGLGVLPDRSSTTTRGAQTTIRLGFDM